MVTLSRNTQGGLGHRLRGRRGGKRAAPTPAEQQRRRQPNGRKGSGARGGKKKRGKARTAWGGERGFSLVTPQSSRARRMRRAEQATTRGRETERKRGGSTAAESSARECGKAAPETPVFIARGGACLRHSRPGRRARGAGPAAAGDCGRGGRGRLAWRSLRDRRAGTAGAWQVLASRSLPALARPSVPPLLPPSVLGDAWAGPRASSPPDGRARPRPGGACAPREQSERAGGRARGPLCEPRG